MKKVLLSTFITLLFSTAIYAQTEKGNFQLEVGITPYSEPFAKTPSTGFALISVDGTTVWSAGGEAGFFIQDNFALKIGAGYSDFDGESSFSYKLGAKYYAGGVVPLQVDVAGATREDFNDSFGGNVKTPDPLYLGFQAGYAFFVNNFISLEPGLRYSLSLNSDFSEEDIFEARIGFVIFL